MIHSTSNLDGYNRTDAFAALHAKSAPAPKFRPASDENLSSASTDALREALGNSPEIRPDVVARAKQLALDVNYPPRQIIEELAKLMVQARDPSE